MEIGFSLGSNMGDRLARLSEAKQLMLEVTSSNVLAQSRVYETEPVDVLPQYAEMAYLNAVLILDSPVSSRDWLRVVGDIEIKMGRRRTADQNAPRPIDIDILYAGEEYIDTGGLTVPHPRWAERRFVVRPLADVRPNLVLPGSGKNVREILQALPETERVTPLVESW